MTKRHNLKIIVTKIGTKVLTGGGYSLDRARMKGLIGQVSELVKKMGIKVVIVSSGAIVSGMGLLGLKNRPAELSKLQACAALGQPHLMQAYEGLFKSHGIMTAQILLTQDDLSDRKRYLNAKHTILTLLDEGAVPIVNENDTVITDEIKFGDNDKLSSLVANLIEADLLVLLSDVDGLYNISGDKIENAVRGQHIRTVKVISKEIESMALKGTDQLGSGGMSSKIQSAKTVTGSGVSCVIANGSRDNILIDIVEGKEAGTMFISSCDKLTAKKKWLGYSAKSKGQITIDAGAKEALVKKNKSLLASGITGASGEFKKNDVIKIMDSDGTEFARGVTNYSSDEINRIKGLKTAQIAKIFDCKCIDEVVHRDNLVIL